MDGRHFDDVARAVGAVSRRSALKALVGAALGGLLPWAAGAQAGTAAACRATNRRCARHKAFCSGYCAGRRCRCRPGFTNCPGRGCVRVGTKERCGPNGVACFDDEVCGCNGCRMAVCANAGEFARDFDDCCSPLVYNQFGSVCEECASLAAYCRVDGDCCATGGDQPVCRVTPGAYEGRRTCCRYITPQNPNPACDYHTACCNGVCEKNFGSQCCRPGGDACTTGAECCSEVCNADGTCAPSAPPEGE